VTVNLPLNIIAFLAMKDVTVVTVFWDVKSIIICCMMPKNILKETKEPLKMESNQFVTFKTSLRLKQLNHYALLALRSTR